MTLLAVSPTIDPSPPTLTGPISRTADRDRGPHNKVWVPPGQFCLRCGGLLVPSYTATLERHFTGEPITLWRCVNCGDCVDQDILANRGKGSGSARLRARPPTGPQRTGQLRGVKTGLTLQGVLECDDQEGSGS